MPILFNSNTGSNSWQAFAVPQRLPRPEVTDVATARNYRPIGRERQGHHPSPWEGPGQPQTGHHVPQIPVMYHVEVRNDVMRYKKH